MMLKDKIFFPEVCNTRKQSL